MSACVLPSRPVRDALSAPDDLVWESLAYASGLPDPMAWETHESRRQFVQGGERRKREKLLDRARTVYNWIGKLRNTPGMDNKADKLISLLRKGEKGRMLHKALIDSPVWTRSWFAATFVASTFKDKVPGDLSNGKNQFWCRMLLGR